jgi:SAM-dependent methyltransferase
MVDRSNAYARSRNVTNVLFKQCAQDSIPLPDTSVDVVVSYDVLEHVDDPRRSMQEIRRVLRPGGKVLLVFPVYFGAFSHHLDYISLVPGLHWMFSAQTLVRAVNQLLASDKRFDTKPQPAPRRSFDGARYVLPNLNGLGGEHFKEVFKDFEVLRLHRHGVIKRHEPRGRTMKMMSVLPNRLLDMITFSVSCVLEKR